jgi:Sigma-70 factor, region 1.1
MQSPDAGLAVAERENERAQRARWLAAELWSGAAPADTEELPRLVADELEKGFLTYDEIAAALEDVELTREQTRTSTPTWPNGRSLRTRCPLV